MLLWLKENIGTLIVGVMLLGAVAAIIARIVRAKRKGRPVMCDCGCKSCPKAAACNKGNSCAVRKK